MLRRLIIPPLPPVYHWWGELVSSWSSFTKYSLDKPLKFLRISVGEPGEIVIAFWHTVCPRSLGSILYYKLHYRSRLIEYTVIISVPNIRIGRILKCKKKHLDIKLIRKICYLARNSGLPPDIRLFTRFGYRVT